MAETVKVELETPKSVIQRLIPLSHWTDHGYLWAAEPNLAP